MEMVMERQPLEVEREPLRRMAVGGMFSSALGAGIDLEVFKKMKGRTEPLEEVARLWDLPAPSTRVLAQVYCTMGLMKYDKGLLCNTPEADKYLGAPKQDLHWIQPLCRFGLDRRDLRRRLSHSHGLNWYQIRDNNMSISFNFYVDERNHNSRLRWGEQLAQTYDFSKHKVMMDVGGASGGWCMGIKKVFPHMRFILFDIPQVTWISKHMIEEAMAGEYIEVETGSFFVDDLPKGTDVILVANILHDWTIEDDRRILKRIHKALPSGGTLLVSEFYFEDDWSGPVEAVNQAYCVLGAEGRSGWQPSYGEMEQLLQEEGFVEPVRKYNLIVAKKP